MVQGIAIFGLNGGGKSTLAHVLAKRLEYFEMDVEDYYFPKQRESRKRALDNRNGIGTEQSGELPFSNPRTKSEVQDALMEDIKKHPKFVLAGVTMNWCEEVLSCVEIAFWVQTPLEERLKRIQAREEKRFGTRVLEGGDMYEQQKAFRKVVENRDLKTVEECAKKFRCPVIILDGTIPINQNLEVIVDHIR